MTTWFVLVLFACVNSDLQYDESNPLDGCPGEWQTEPIPTDLPTRVTANFVDPSAVLGTELSVALGTPARSESWNGQACHFDSTLRVTYGERTATTDTGLTLQGTTTLHLAALHVVLVTNLVFESRQSPTSPTGQAVTNLVSTPFDEVSIEIDVRSDCLSDAGDGLGYFVGTHTGGSARVVEQGEAGLALP